MQLLRSDDPRSNFARASRYELVKCAEAHGIKEISYGCPLGLDQMIEVLERNGIHDIRVPERPLGVYVPVVLGADQPEKQEVQAAVSPEISGMTRAQLAKECKSRGIKMARTDSKETLIAKLNGENPSQRPE